MKKIFIIVVFIISIFCLYGCGSKKIYSEEDKIKFAEEMVNYDKIEKYDRLDISIYSSKKKERKKYFYAFDFNPSVYIYGDSISLYSNRGITEGEQKGYNQIIQKTEYELEKNVKAHLTSLIKNEYDSEGLINTTKTEMTEKDFLDNYLCKTVETFSIDLLQAKNYYGIYRRESLEHVSFDRYFIFDNYEYNLELFEYTWDMLITKMFFYSVETGYTHENSFTHVEIEAIDKNDKDMKYLITWFIKKV